VFAQLVQFTAQLLGLQFAFHLFGFGHDVLGLLVQSGGVQILRGDVQVMQTPLGGLKIVGIFDRRPCPVLCGPRVFFVARTYTIGGMKHVRTTTTYLEMHAPSPQSVVAPVADATIERVHLPTVDFYRFLYNSVGGQYNWVDRNLMPRDELERAIQDERVEIHVLRVAGQTAGYAELDRRVPGEIELAYFGLFPRFVGLGLGKYFLAWVVDRSWSYQPARVWVHTCDLDHEAALPNYLKAGFTIYDEKVIEQIVDVL
jgi:GNAT superfamily N-acetyltransferase